MMRCQFSLTALVLVVSALGALWAGLFHGNIILCGAVALVTMLVLGVSVLAMIFQRGSQQAAAIGFVVFGVGYLLLISFTGGDLANSALEQIYVAAHGDVPYPGPSVLQEQITELEDRILRTRAISSQGQASIDNLIQKRDSANLALSDIEARYHFAEIAQYCLAVLLGCLGGVVAKHLYLVRHLEDASRRNSPP